MSKKKTHKYPEPDEVCINESDLKIKFQEFYEAVKGEFSPLDLFIIIPAWVPVFQSSFDEMFGLSGSSIMGGYTTLVSVGTLIWLGRKRWFRSLPIIRWLFNFFRDEVSKTLSKVSDPESKIEEIKDQCK